MVKKGIMFLRMQRGRVGVWLTDEVRVYWRCVWVLRLWPFVHRGSLEFLDRPVLLMAYFSVCRYALALRVHKGSRALSLEWVNMWYCVTSSLNKIIFDLPFLLSFVFIYLPNKWNNDILFLKMFLKIRFNLLIL